ncbi:MAG: RNA polymerase sigma factor [Phycisphaerales bacterium]|nr:RNA polymerase sigma factor [Phycisphaerales bacterium]
MTASSNNPSPYDASASGRIARAVDVARPKLLVIAAAIVGRVDGAEDIVQDATRIALEKSTDVADVQNLPAWLAQVVRNVALNARRANQRRPAPRSNELLDARTGRREPPPPPIASDGRILPNQDAFDDQVMAALNDLDERARACLMLRVILGLPYKEIAETLGIPEGTAMSHVLRSRRTLAERLAHQQEPND